LENVDATVPAAPAVPEVGSEAELGSEQELRSAQELRWHAIGRRKTSTARVYLTPGSGKWVVNGRTLGDFFPRRSLVQHAQQPFVATDTLGAFDVKARLAGGGMTGQAGALRLGIARALVAADETHRKKLREHGLLTRDARAVERKKPGQPGARKRFQFSKR
jgi:small subunit ribosomal protein S9